MSWSGSPTLLRTSRQKLSRRHVATVVLLWVVLYASFTLVRPALLDDADSVHAEVAREMLVRHDWVTLHANGIRYLEKAPLLYWSMASSYAIFGVHDWAARLPLAFYTLALFLVVYDLGRRMFQSEIAGFYAALILLTSFGIFIYTRILIPDVMVCLWLTLALGFFWVSLDQEKPSLGTALGFAAACALNVLTKGLIGIVFPVGIVVIYLLLTGNLKHLRRWHPVASLVVFLLMAAPWHIAAGLANPAHGHPVGLIPTEGNVRGFFWYYFVDDEFLRYLNRRVPRDYGTVPLGIFWGLLVLWLAPWIAWIGRALGEIPFRRVIARWFSRPSGFVLSRRESSLLMLAVWAAFVMVFFSFSTRQEYYSLPALPALALMVGGWLAEDESASGQGNRRIASIRIAWVLAVLGAVGAATASFFAWVGQTPRPGEDLASMLSEHPHDYVLSLGHFLDLSSRAMGAFRIPLILTAVALLAGTGANLFFRHRRRARLANYSLAAMMVVFLVAAHMAMVTFSPMLSSKVLADRIQQRIQPGDIVEIHGDFEAGSTLGFYLERRVRLLNGRDADLWYGSFFRDAPRIFDNDQSFARIWNGSHRVFLWTEMDHVPHLPGPSCVLANSGGKQILTNRPPC